MWPLLTENTRTMVASIWKPYRLFQRTLTELAIELGQFCCWRRGARRSIIGSKWQRGQRNGKEDEEYIQTSIVDESTRARNDEEIERKKFIEERKYPRIWYDMLGVCWFCSEKGDFGFYPIGIPLCEWRRTCFPEATIHGNYLPIHYWKYYPSDNQLPTKLAPQRWPRRIARQRWLE